MAGWPLLLHLTRNYGCVNNLLSYFLENDVEQNTEKFLVTYPATTEYKLLHALENNIEQQWILYST